METSRSIETTLERFAAGGETGIGFETIAQVGLQREHYFRVSQCHLDVRPWRVHGICYGDPTPFGGIFLAYIAPLGDRIQVPTTVRYCRGQAWVATSCYELRPDPNVATGPAGGFEIASAERDLGNVEAFFEGEFLPDENGNIVINDDLPQRPVVDNAREQYINTARAAARRPPTANEEIARYRIHPNLPRGLPCLSIDNPDIQMGENWTNEMAGGFVVRNSGEVQAQWVPRYVPTSGPIGEAPLWSAAMYNTFIALNDAATKGMPNPDKMLAARIVLFRIGLVGTKLSPEIIEVQDEVVPVPNERVEAVSRLVADDQFVANVLVNAIARLVNWRNIGNATGGAIASGAAREAMQATGWDREKPEDAGCFDKNMLPENARLFTTQWYRTYHPCSPHLLQVMTCGDRLETWALANGSYFFPKVLRVKSSLAAQLAPQNGVAGTKVVVETLGVLKRILQCQFAPALSAFGQAKALIEAGHIVRAWGLQVGQNSHWYWSECPSGQTAVPFDQEDPAFEDITAELAVAAVHGMRVGMLPSSPHLRKLARRHGDQNMISLWRSLFAKTRVIAADKTIELVRWHQKNCGQVGIASIYSEDSEERASGYGRINKVVDLIKGMYGENSVAPYTAPTDDEQVKINRAASKPSPVPAAEEPAATRVEI